MAPLDRKTRSIKDQALPKLPGLRDFRALPDGVKLALAVLNRRLQLLPRAVPRALFLALTTRCQLSCAHCRYRQGAGASRRARDIAPALALKALRQAAAAGIPRVIFFGGEPTLSSALRPLIKAAAGLGLFTELDTNGRRLLEKGFPEALRSAGLCAARISLHSSSAAAHDALSGRGSFAATGRAVAASKRAGLLTYISSCVFSGNAAESTDRLVAMAAARGAHGLRLLPFVPGGGSSALPLRLSAELSARGTSGYAGTCVPAGARACAAALGEVVYIDTAGGVKVCPYASGRLGTLTRTKLASLLRAGRRLPAAFPCQNPA
jgi:MoaA/NifB/PqqE/SkfB family radical SAM enzyme